ncbi:hypothetical protein ACF8PD_03805 [Vibrio plantisponsor]|jgi:ribosomal protein L44E|uniref:hypothetical protein n=1 Tax=Vibrio plantisponsor TaxID=664643 RepID=UPI000C9E2544|nr:hypothetical protein C1M56_01570 [Vibrio diazotrophicus]
MPEAFCNCCRKTTQHKVVMRRCSSEAETSWQAVHAFLSKIFNGEHYYPMEQQMFCRECNHKLVVASNKYTGADTVKV